MKINHSNSTIEKENFNYISDIVLNNFVGEGERVNKLEDKLKTYLNKKYCVIVNNGSNALFLGLKAIACSSSDKNEVIVSAYVCPAVINSILQADLKPVLVDINKTNLNASIAEIKNKINSNTIGIIIASIGGVSIEFETLMDYNIPVIEDICQSIGTKTNNKLAGVVGDFAIMSFGSTKMISGGVGGAILCNDERSYEKIKKMTEYEKDSEFYLKNDFEVSYNMKLSDLSAGLILAQFKAMPDFIHKRKIIAENYDAILKGKKNVTIIKETENEFFNRYRYYFITEEVEKFYNVLRSNGIDARKSLAHNIAKYLRLNNFDNLNYLSNKIISLPIYPNLNVTEQNFILKVLKNV